jgi:hypothetical protein
MGLSLIFCRLGAYWIQNTARNHHVIKIELEHIANEFWMATMVVTLMASNCAKK